MNVLEKPWRACRSEDVPANGTRESSDSLSVQSRKRLNPFRSARLTISFGRAAKLGNAALDQVAGALVDDATLGREDFPNEVKRRNPRRVLDPLKAILKTCFGSPAAQRLGCAFGIYIGLVLCPHLQAAASTHVRRGSQSFSFSRIVQLGAKIHDGERVPKETFRPTRSNWVLRRRALARHGAPTPISNLQSSASGEPRRLHSLSTV